MLARSAARSLVIAAATAALAVSGLTITSAASADPAGPSTSDPATVTTDALPAPQIDGVVWSQTIVGNTVYAAGSFTTARPAGAAVGAASQVPRANVLAYDLTTGALISSFAPATNAEVKSVAASPDGKTIYLGGAFTTVNGTNKYRIAAVDASTGALIPSFNVSADTVVSAIAATSNAVYFGGNFNTVNGSSRPKVAAVSPSGTLLPMTATVAGGSVQALAVSPDGSKVVIGGTFTSVNGSGSNATDPNGGWGLAMLSSDSGAMAPLSINRFIRNAGDKAAITSLTADANGFYGTGYNYGTKYAGAIEGTFSGDWKGNERWLQDCHGDSYSVAVSGDVAYTASHHHMCSNANGFPQTNPWTFYRGTASTTYATGTNQREMYGYADHEGEPAPGELNWFPNFTTGSYTGLGQAAWSVATSADGKYVVYGGEFPSVNGTAQQGLVRFAKTSLSTNKQGPRLYGATLKLSAKSTVAGQVRVTWPGNYDRDDATLTYNLYRGTGTNTPTTLVSTQTQTAKFWNTQQMSYTDTGVVAGQTYSYLLKVLDPAKNTATSTPATVTVSTTGAAYDAYAQKVLDLGASTYYRLDDAGTTVADTAGAGDTNSFSTLTPVASGAVATDGAKTFNGGTNDIVVSPTAAQSPTAFTEAIWFKTNSYGKLVGYGSSANTANSSSYDRQLYMDSNGYLNFGVYDGANRVVTSGVNYKDSQWHFAVGTLGSEGMKLYVDGKLAAERGDVTQGTGYTGYWHVGGDAVWSGKNRFTGSLDEFSAFPTALSAAQIASLYATTGRAAGVPAAPTDGYGASVYSDNPSLYWRLGEATGTTAADFSVGNKPGGYAGNLTQGVDGVTSADKAVTLTAPTNGGLFGWGAKAAGTVTASRAVYSPRVFSEEVWIKTTTTSGGRILGFGSGSGTSTSSTYDRMLWMLDSGKVAFGVGPSGASGVQLTSAAALNDGKWHHVVATFGAAAGAQLYVDGALDSSSTAVVVPSYYSGYWRVGADATWGGNTNSYFLGSVDEAAVYSSALTASQVRSHYAAAGFNVAPTASFNATRSGLTVSVDASASTDADGSVASYAWDFGDGTTTTTTTTPTTTHTYTAGGAKTITLTVTDNLGSSSVAVSKNVSFSSSPTAAFTSKAAKLTVSFDGSTSVDPDGTVVSYAWDFADGTSPGSGVSPTHTYVAAGTYMVKLTVTDDSGNTATTSNAVTVAANQPPVASFTSTGTGLTAAFDGTTSTDPDDQVVSYAWDFGDGTSDSSATTSHVYQQAGNYQVTLTVTDQDGAKGSKTVTYTAAAPGAIAKDAFARTTTSGWGTSDQGGPWVVTGGAANYKVTAGAGTMTLDKAGMTRTAYLSQISRTSADTTAKLSLDKVATGGGSYLGLLGRQIDTKGNYLARVKLNPDGTLRLQIVRTLGSTATTLKDVAIPGTHVAGQVYDVRFQVIGNGTTALNAKAWIDGTTEPTAWQATTTDSSADLQAPGSVGAWAYTSASSTNAPLLASVDDFSVVDPQ